MPQDTRPHELGTLQLGEAFLEDFADTLPTYLQAPPSEHLEPPEPSASDCLSEDEVLNFTAGALAPALVWRIDEHLAQCSTCSRVVTDLLGELTPRSATHALLVPCVFPPSTQVARRFVIERLIGRGGMGEVYAALDLRHGRTVALKTVLAARCDSRQAMARLVGELHATRAIEHPNVCRARGMGLHADDAGHGIRCRFIVMDYIEGETLGQRTRRDGALPLPRALRVARQLLLGLEAIHAAGIVHLDVKSDNVMLSAGDEPRAVLIDFGLARTTLPGKSAPHRRGSPRGTVSYMAPEQLLDQPVGPHTDVFGFGVVMYELLTGTHPFCTRHPSSLDSLALLETRPLGTEDLPLRPSRALASVSTHLDDFVARCTAPDPLGRFADAKAALAHFDSLGS